MVSDAVHRLFEQHKTHNSIKVVVAGRNLCAPVLRAHSCVLPRSTHLKINIFSSLSMPAELLQGPQDSIHY